MVKRGDDRGIHHDTYHLIYIEPLDLQQHFHNISVAASAG